MKYLLSLILCNFCLLLMGQETNSSLQIKVLDSANAPIEYANVALYLSSDTSLVYGGITNAEGLFQLEEIKPQNYILKVSYIGYADYETTFVPQAGFNNLAPIILSDSNLSLSEITVVGHKPLVSMEKGVLTTSVANSLLSSLGTAEDVLKHIPGLDAKNDKYTVLGKGEAIIYIDNRKVQDNSELQNLASENILKVELITNPGAEYDAETRSVLKITTNKKRENGFSMSLRGVAKQNHKFSHGEKIEMNYHHEGLNVFALYGFQDSKMREVYDLDYQIAGDTLWQQKDISIYHKKSLSHDLTTGVQYDWKKKHTVGARYRFVTNDFTNNPATGSYEIYANGVLTEQTNTSGPNFSDTKAHQLNAFYQGTFTDKLNLQVDMDYVKQNQGHNSETREESLLNNNLITTFTENNNHFSLYAGKAVLRHQANENLSFQYGTEYSLVKGDGIFLSNAVPNNDFMNREEKIAAFASTDFMLKKLAVAFGLRYEYVKSKAEEYGETTVDKNYSNLFPSLSLSLPIKDVNMSLNFSNRVSRPAFSILNNNISYTSKFHQEMGNPALQPMKIYDLDYSIGYKFLQFRFNYQYINDYISLYTQPSDVSQAVTLTSFINYPKYQQIVASLIAEHRIGFWTPSFTASVYKQFFSTNFEGIVHHYEKPSFDFTLDNYFNLPWGIILNVDLMYNTGGNFDTQHYEPYGTIDIGLRKSFLNDALQVSLWGYDLGKWQDYTTKEQLGRLYTHRYADTDTRYVALTITWKFNNFKNKYKGQSAAGEEINRL